MEEEIKGQVKRRDNRKRGRRELIAGFENVSYTEKVETTLTQVKYGKKMGPQTYNCKEIEFYQLPEWANTLVHP